MSYDQRTTANPRTRPVGLLHPPRVPCGTSQLSGDDSVGPLVAGVLEAILMKPIEKPEASKPDRKIGFRWHVLAHRRCDEGTPCAHYAQ